MSDVPHCEYVTGRTRLLGHLGPLSDYERQHKLGQKIDDDHYEWKCGLRASWIVEGPSGVMTACSRDLHAVADDLGPEVQLTRVA